MIYTPQVIKDYILKSIIDSSKLPTICDPACGCGSFLLSAADYLHEAYKISFNEIFKDYIFGVDIIPHNIDKSKTLFHVLALTKGEVLNVNFNLKVGDSLSINWSEMFDGKKFDCVIGNPPYVRARNVALDVKENLKSWKTAIGNVDLYIPFYELGINILSKNGRLGYISVSTFLKSLNGRSLRNFLVDNGFKIKIVDFGSFQVFKNITSYTCIVLIDKAISNRQISYASLNDIDSINDIKFSIIDYSNHKKDLPWKLGDNIVLDNIEKIENVGVMLGSYKIRNGLATLKNDIYFFTPVKEDDQYYYRQFDGGKYKIEKSVCINVAKPNIIKNEKELKEKMEIAIFPYSIDGNSIKVIAEDVFRNKHPNAYDFLCSVKDTLDKRDKGNANYAEWFAYGRTQGLDNFGKKLLIPYIANQGVAVLSDNKNILFYCGYALFHDDSNELRVIKKIIESSVFWYYIKNTSKPYSSGYYSLAKNYIKTFGIPKLNTDEKESLLGTDNKEQVDKFLLSIYKIKI